MGDKNIQSFENYAKIGVVHPQFHFQLCFRCFSCDVIHGILLRTNEIDVGNCKNYCYPYRLRYIFETGYGTLENDLASFLQHCYDPQNVLRIR